MIIEDQENEDLENSVTAETAEEPTVLRKITSFIQSGMHFHLGAAAAPHEIPDETQLRKISSYPVELSSIDPEPKMSPAYNHHHSQSHFGQKRRAKFYHSARYQTRPVRKFSHLTNEDEVPRFARNSLRASKKSSTTAFTVMADSPIVGPRITGTAATPNFSK